MTTIPLGLPFAVPVALPGMLPLPGTTPTPHDPAAADPFLALLSQLVAPVAEAEVEEVPVAEPEDEPEPQTEDGAEPADLPVATEVAVLPLPTLVRPPAIAPPAPEPTAPTPEPATAVAAPAPTPEAPEAIAPAPTPVLPTATVTPVAAVSAPSAPAAPGTPDAPAPVTRQVFPEVVRAAVSGVTPNRVVVRLQPEHLGEVRVVLRTDRAGTLEVSLAGGPEARAAIREGAPELRRMLEVAGSHDAKVVVRHLTEPATPATSATAVAATPAAPPTSARTDVPTTTGGLPVDVGAGSAGGTAHGTSQGTSQGEHGRGRTPQDARPGATDGIPDRDVETTPRPAARRAAGLDVMM